MAKKQFRTLIEKYPDDGYANIARSNLGQLLVSNHEYDEAISLYKEYRGLGIGSQLMVKMLELLKCQGYKRASLAVQKANYAVKMYETVGFKTVDENAEYSSVVSLTVIWHTASVFCRRGP